VKLRHYGFLTWVINRSRFPNCRNC
jgi:hypothetical protein